jgi:cytochrome c553
MLEAATPAVVESCRRCHGVDGRGRGVPAFPRLAGQRPAYLLAALQAFARGERHSGIMAPVASDLRPEDMRELAVYYGGLAEPASPEPPGEAAPAIERGQAIARRGIPSQRVPACADCHGPSEIVRNPAYPILAGQYAEYLVLQLELFKEERRGGSPYARLMRPVAGRLTSEQMRDVALYYESLWWPSPPRRPPAAPTGDARRGTPNRPGGRRRRVGRWKPRAGAGWPGTCGRPPPAAAWARRACS